MSPACWSITGLSMSLLGIVTLFVFQMPSQVRRGGAIYAEIQQRDQRALKREKWYDRLGWPGLFLVVVGTLCQIVANIPASTR
jgi:hypothetical protein